MGNITIQGDITATVPGNAVGGASALTTPGSVPFVTAAGVLGQSANLFWDNANGRLGVGRNNPSTVLHVEAANPAFTLTRTAISNLTITNSGSGVWSYTANGGQGLSFGITGGAEWARLAPTSGNLLLGTTTDDGTNRLQVAGSVAVGGLSGANSSIAITRTGSGLSSLQLGAFNNKPTVIFNGTSGLAFETFSASLMNLSTGGTLALYNEAPTIGSTSFVVRAGAGQTGNLQTWQSSAGATLAFITDGGRASFSGSVSIGSSALDTGLLNAGTGVKLGSGSLVGWNNAASVSSSNPDLSLSRNAGSALQIGDGGANANGDLLYRNAFLTGTVFLGGGADGSFLSSGLNFKSTGVFAFSSTTNATATKDLSLSRASANTLQVGDGGANANGTVVAREFGLVAGTRFLYNTGGGNVSIGNAYGALTLIGSGENSIGSLTQTGTLTLHSQIPTVGSTSLVVRAGAGQGANALTTWQDSTGATAARFNGATGGFVNAFFIAGANGSRSIYVGDSGLVAGSAGRFTWSSNTPDNAVDTALARYSTGRVSIDSGTAIGTTPGNARDIMARGFYAAETTTDPSAADLTIAGSNTQDVAAIYVKNDKLVVAYNRSGTVNYLTIPLDGATTTFTQSTTAP